MNTATLEQSPLRPETVGFSSERYTISPLQDFPATGYFDQNQFLNMVAGPPGSYLQERGYYLPKHEAVPVELRNKLTALSALRPGWDGDSAPAIRRSAIEEAFSVIHELSGSFSHFKTPHIVPTFGGFLQIEWHDEFRSLEFELTSEGWSVLGVDSVRAKEPKYFEETVPEDERQVLEMFYYWFTKRDLIWPSR